MKKIIKNYISLPLEEGKTYQTKFCTLENFTITKIKYIKNKAISVEGIYENAPHLGICPLAVERLIPEKIESDQVEVCSNCLEPI